MSHLNFTGTTASTGDTATWDFCWQYLLDFETAPNTYIGVM